MTDQTFASLLSDRMNLLDITPEQLAERTFNSKNYVQKLLAGTITIIEINPYDLALISSVLHCQPHYFSNRVVRSNDLINQHACTTIPQKVSVNIQNYLSDMNFISSLV